MNGKLIRGDVRSELKRLPAESVHCVACSPPYWQQRSYLAKDHPDKSLELGNERTVGEYVSAMVEVFREVRRVLHPSGICWINIGDSFAGADYRMEASPHRVTASAGNRIGHRSSFRRDRSERQDAQHKASDGIKAKDRCLIPFRLAIALCDDGWWMRRDVVWAKGVSCRDDFAGSAMPESVDDRPVTSHEYVLMLTKRAYYFYDAEAVREQGTYPAGTLAAKGSVARLNGIGVNGRPPEYANYSGTRNLRSVWAINPEPLDLEVCEACHRVYNRREMEQLEVCEDKRVCHCGHRERWISHYATFPTKLARLCLLAGTSAKGVCPRCLEPWVRIVEKTASTMNIRVRNGLDGTLDKKYGRRNDEPSIVAQAGTYKETAGDTRTVGWKPGCACGAGEPISATCLDPFMGSGTTAVVAAELGLRFIGIDLSEDYHAIAERRLLALTPGMRLA